MAKKSKSDKAVIIITEYMGNTNYDTYSLDWWMGSDVNTCEQCKTEFNGIKPWLHGKERDVCEKCYRSWEFEKANDWGCGCFMCLGDNWTWEQFQTEQYKQNYRN